MGFYTLIDRNGKSQGEFIRLIFAQAKITYEDNRVTEEEFQALKDTLPTGTIPVLNSAGSLIGETNAIARYLGGLYNLYGANAMEKARVDQVLELTHRLANFFHASFVKDVTMDKTMEANMKSLREYGLKKAPEVLTHLEKQLNDNGGQFFAGSKISIADIASYFFLTFIAEHDAEFSAILKKQTTLNDHAQRVATSPQIAAYLK